MWDERWYFVAIIDNLTIILRVWDFNRLIVDNDEPHTNYYA